MNAHEQERMAKLLKKSVPPVGDQLATELGRDLWPAMLRRLQERQVAVPWFDQAWFDQAWFDQAWFDWALLGTVAVLLAFFPAAIPLLLYHL